MVLKSHYHDSFKFLKGRIRGQTLHLLKGKREDKDLVNKQQSDTLYLFFLIQHLEAKLCLLSQRRDTVAKQDICFLQDTNV